MVFVVSGGSSLRASRLPRGSGGKVERWVVKGAGMVWAASAGRGIGQQGFRDTGPVRNDEAFLFLPLPRKSLWRHSGWS